VKKDRVLIIKEVILLVVLGLGNVFTLWAFSTRDKEGILLFFLGIILLICPIGIVSILSFLRHATTITIHTMLLGVLLGVLTGIFGIWKSLLVFLAYEARGMVGAMVGGGLGAFIGAFVGVVFHLLARERTKFGSSSSGDDDL
jgi:hypothetical protein